MTKAELVEALDAARFILTPLSHKGLPDDVWRLNRARWLYRYGDRALAVKEFRDIQAVREALTWDGVPNRKPFPEGAIEMPVGASA